MKPIVGVLIIAIVTVTAFLLYSNFKDKSVFQEGQVLPAPASINESIEIKEKESVEEGQNEPEKNTETPSLPDLESFKGLEEESNFVSEITDTFLEEGDIDPLKEVLQ